MMGKKSGVMVVSVLLLASISAVLINSLSVFGADTSSAADDSSKKKLVVENVKVGHYDFGGGKWTINNLYLKKDYVYQGVYSVGSADQGEIDASVIPDELSGGKQIHTFEYDWLEGKHQTGHSIVLYDNAGNKVMGSGTNNPQWCVTDQLGNKKQIWGANGYERWIHYKFTFHWDNGTYDYYMEDLKTGDVRTGTRPLLNATNVEEIRFSHGYGSAEHCRFDFFKVNGKPLNLTPSKSVRKMAPGEMLLNVTADVKNIGTEQAFKGIKVYKDNERVDAWRVSLPPGGSEMKSFSFKLYESGDHEIKVGEAPPVTVTIIQRPFTPEYSGFKCPVAVKVGEDFEVGATVKNIGGYPGTKKIKLYKDNESVDSKTVSLDPGETEYVSFTRTFSEPVLYRIGNFSREVKKPPVWIDSNKNNQLDPAENLYVSLEKASKEARAGDWIVFRPGVHHLLHPPLKVSQGDIVIKSPGGPEGTVIVGDRDHYCFSIKKGVENVTVEGFKMKNAFMGINTLKVSNLTIKNNVFDNTLEKAMRIRQSGNKYVTIENNVFMTSQKSIQTHNLTDSTVKNNIFKGSGANFLLGGGSLRNTVENNVFEGAACLFGNASNNTVENNVFTSTPVRRTFKTNSPNNSINYNNMVGGASVLTDYGFGVPVDMTMNWWGSIHGPTGVKNVSKEVRYSPWLTAPVGTEQKVLGYNMGVTIEKKDVEVGEHVEGTLSVGVEAENMNLAPSIVASPYYRGSLERSSPAEWTFDVRPTDKAAGKDVKVRFELYAENFCHVFGPTPMVRRSVTLHVSS